MKKEINIGGLRVYSVLTEAGLKKALDIEIDCADCNGEGRVEEIDWWKVHSATIDIPYKYVKCEKCDGTGVIENDLNQGD